MICLHFWNRSCRGQISYIKKGFFTFKVFLKCHFPISFSFTILVQHILSYLHEGTRLVWSVLSYLKAVVFARKLNGFELKFVWLFHAMRLAVRTLLVPFVYANVCPENLDFIDQDLDTEIALSLKKILHDSNNSKLITSKLSLFKM